MDTERSKNGPASVSRSSHDPPASSGPADYSADHIEHFYNSDRRHSSLVYLTPMRLGSYAHHPAGHFVPKRWSTEWGQAHMVGLPGFEPGTS
jgi:transposase InsO family protein